MLLTESVARQNWCPQAHIPVQGSKGAINVSRAPGSTANTRCFGAGCMAWRWAGWRNKTFGVVAPCPDPIERDGERLGYCGLAGRPDMGREP